jgi:hypothetical protein
MEGLPASGPIALPRSLSPTFAAQQEKAKIRGYPYFTV